MTNSKKIIAGAAIVSLLGITTALTSAPADSNKLTLIIDKDATVQGVQAFVKTNSGKQITYVIDEDAPVVIKRMLWNEGRTKTIKGKIIPKGLSQQDKEKELDSIK